MKLKIVTPEGIIYQNERVEAFTLPTQTGVVTIKEDHIPLISLITPGEVVVTREDENGFTDDSLAISKGVVQISENEIKVLADTAERAEDIDIERAEEARKRAEEFRKNKEVELDIDFAAVQAQIEKELARIEVGRKYKNVGGSV